jgi:hypothetical protein
MRVLSVFLILGLLLAACGGATDAPEASDPQQMGEIEVFRAPG